MKLEYRILLSWVLLGLGIVSLFVVSSVWLFLAALLVVGVLRLPLDRELRKYDSTIRLILLLLTVGVVAVYEIFFADILIARWVMWGCGFVGCLGLAIVDVRRLARMRREM